MSVEKIALLLLLLSAIALASKIPLRIIGRQAMTAKPSSSDWSELNVSALRQAFRDNMTVSDTAGLLLRTEEGVREKAGELGIALRNA
jgi:hypothetical protein